MPHNHSANYAGIEHDRVLVIGGGLTGCTVAYQLARHGVASVVVERSSVPGGLVRSGHLGGVLYEPSGSHIFHTEDAEVWRLANELTPFNDYRHRVDIVIENQLLHWPICVSDLDRQSRGEEIRQELMEREHVDAEHRAEAANFEEWCLELMGPILYERYIKPYTMKQWGRPPAELSASWAPRRVGVRWDDDPYLFPDTFQGWPSGPNGYTDLIGGLLASPLIELHVEETATLDNVADLAARFNAESIVLTCPLDEFASFGLGELEWRGIAVHSVYLPDRDLAQTAMVVNYPSLAFPFIRVHETKHASRQVCEGTVLGFEFTGAPSRYYPVELPGNRRLNDQYRDHIARTLGDRVRFVGRLANYVYIDMDDCMRAALDCATELLESVYRTVA